MMGMIYISGPITGDKAYRQKFRAAAEQLKARGYNVVNPAELDDVLPVESMTWSQILDHCLDLLGRCDAVVVLPGWEESRGCNREVGYAQGVGMIILPIEELLQN